MTTTKKPSENRDGKPFLLKVSVTDRTRAEMLAEKAHLPPTTWLYSVFKAALDDGESVGNETHNGTQ